MIKFNLKNKSQILLGETLANLSKYIPLEKSYDYHGFQHK